MSNLETGTGTSRVMFLNSGDATQNLNAENLTTDYLFIPEEQIVVPEHHNIIMSLYHCAIPHSFYNFRFNRNCRLDYSATAYNTTAAADSGFIELKEGTYNAQSLMTQITTKINLVAGGTLSMTFNRDTLKYDWNWVGAGAGSQRLTLRLANGANADVNFKNEIGFNKNKWIGGVEYDVYFENDGANFRCGYSTNAASTQLFTTGTTTTLWDGYNTANTINYFSAVDVMASIRSLYVRTNLTTNSILDSSIGGGYSSILARIPIDVSSSDVITVSPSDGSVHKLLLKVKYITSFSVRLTDQKNRLVDLNGLDWDISVQFDFEETPDLKPPPKDKRLKVQDHQYKRFKDTKKEKKK
jgi:hypothetical protein